MAHASPRTVLVAGEVVVGMQAPDLAFASLGPQALAGFERPIELLRCRWASGSR